MTDASLSDLIDRNRAYTDRLPDGYFDDVQEGQQPAVVSLCCSDSRVSQEGMWNVDEPGWLFAPSNIGNVAWDERDGERVVDGNLAYPLVHADTRTAVVVGHTDCGAVTAAYGHVTEGFEDLPGIERRVELLVPVVEAGLDHPAIDQTAPDAEVIDELVEYNVRRQVEFLREHEHVPDDVDVYGFVFDLHGAYGDAKGRTYLVAANGEDDPGALREQVPAEYESHVRSLLQE